jgi:hypothetical protein
MSSNQTQRVEKLTGECEDWYLVGSTNDYNVTFENSWANYGSVTAPARFYKDKFNVVHLAGQIDSGSSGTDAFTLPAGYRPEYINEFAIEAETSGGAGGHGAHAHCTIDTDGTVNCSFTGTSVTWFCFDGVSFRAA